MNKNDYDGEENEQTDFSDDEDEEKYSRLSTIYLLKDAAVDITRRYNLKQSRCFTFDQCKNDCTVFLGGRLVHCPTCKKPRFRVCSKHGCKTVCTDNTCEQ